MNNTNTEISDEEINALIKINLDEFLIDLGDDDDGYKKSPDDKKADTILDDVNNVLDNKEALLPETGFEKLIRPLNSDSQNIKYDYHKFRIWYSGMLKVIKSEGTHKVLVCRALLNYIFSYGMDPDAVRLWCVCMSGHSGFLFKNPNDYDESYMLVHFIELKDDIDELLYKIYHESAVTKQAKDLLNNITNGTEKCVDCDLKDIKTYFYNLAENKSDYLMDNLDLAIDKIVRSPELSQIIPLVLWWIKVKKFTYIQNKYCYEVNFNNIIGNDKERKIDVDNRKNIKSMKEQLELYEYLLTHINDCDKMLCNCGFEVISNIMECKLIDWQDYPCIDRPFEAIMRSGNFTCFPAGNEDNPYFSELDIDPKYLDSYAENNKSEPEKAKILEIASDYIGKHEEIGEKLISMIEKNKTDRCVSLVFEIIERSGIDTSLITPGQVDVVFSLIIRYVMDDIDRHIRCEMLFVLDTIMEHCEDEEI